jgi:hypothetical protein
MSEHTESVATPYEAPVIEERTSLEGQLITIITSASPS